jgi:hypothetical protein
MKSTTKRAGTFAAALLLCIGSLSSCDSFEENRVQDITGPTLSSSIKFFNFGVGAPSVNFYADETKMTAITSGTGTESTNGVAYGGAGAGGFYIGIEPGQYTFTGRISATLDKNLPIATVNGTIESGKAYSYYMSGIYNTTTKTVEAFIVEDPKVIPTDYTIAHVRFVNAISNASPLILYAKYTTGDTTKVDTLGTAVAYPGAGAFATLPAGVYNLFARYADSTANKITRNAVSFLGGRVYTIGARGNITVATGTTAPALDQTANR